MSTCNPRRPRGGGVSCPTVYHRLRYRPAAGAKCVFLLGVRGPTEIVIEGATVPVRGQYDRDRRERQCVLGRVLWTDAGRGESVALLAGQPDPGPRAAP